MIISLCSSVFAVKFSAFNEPLNKEIFNENRKRTDKKKVENTFFMIFELILL